MDFEENLYKINTSVVGHTKMHSCFDKSYVVRYRVISFLFL